MLITRQLLRILAVALPLTAAAYSQALVNYGAAVATGSAAGTAAGKKVSDALTSVMNEAAKSSKSANDVAAAEAKILQPEKAVKPEEYKSLAKAANMAQAPEAGPSAPSAGAAPARATSTLVASKGQGIALDHSIARTRRGAKAAPPVEAVAEAVEPAAPVEELPITLQLALLNIHPVLVPMTERAQRIVPGSTREDLTRILGKPASRVSIPGERDMNEIYYYQEKGRPVATIRMEAGTVTTVSMNTI